MKFSKSFIFAFLLVVVVLSKRPADSARFLQEVTTDCPEGQGQTQTGSCQDCLISSCKACKQEDFVVGTMTQKQFSCTKCNDGYVIQKVNNIGMCLSLGVCQAGQVPTYSTSEGKFVCKPCSGLLDYCSTCSYNIATDTSSLGSLATMLNYDCTECTNDGTLVTDAAGRKTCEYAEKKAEQSIDEDANCPVGQIKMDEVLEESSKLGEAGTTIKVCKPCLDYIGRCAECSYDTTKEKPLCSKCQDGYDLTQDGCQLKKTENPETTQCDLGQIAYPSSTDANKILCYQCDRLLKGCRTCQEEDGHARCVGCQNLHYLDSNGECINLLDFIDSKCEDGEAAIPTENFTMSDYTKYSDNSSSDSSSSDSSYSDSSSSDGDRKWECKSCQSFESMSNCNECKSVLRKNGDEIETIIQCQKCADGYLLDKNFTCKPQSTSNVCPVGQYSQKIASYGDQSAYKCLKCSEKSENCKVCRMLNQKDVECTVCQSGFAKSKEGKCEKCADDCLACTAPGDKSKCMTWKTTEESENECEVDNCGYCGKDGSCLKCTQGFALYAGECKECETDNCQSCYWSTITAAISTNSTNAKVSAKGERCALCEEGYYVMNGVCQKAKEPCSIENCEECVKGQILGKSTEICRRCADRTGVDENGQCQPCSTGCEKCAYYSFKSKEDAERKLEGEKEEKNKNSVKELFTTIPRCLVCGKGYTLTYNNETNASECQTCPENCAACGKDGKCQMCTPGFYLNNKTGTCDYCADQISDCQLCRPFMVNETEKVACLQCPDGKYYNSAKGTCSSCHNDCLTCTGGNSTQCLTCSSGLSLLINTTKGSNINQRSCVNSTQCESLEEKKGVYCAKEDLKKFDDETIAQATARLMEMARVTADEKECSETDEKYLCSCHGKVKTMVEKSKGKKEDIMRVLQEAEKKDEKKDEKEKEEKKEVEKYEVSYCQCDSGYRGTQCEYHISSYVSLMNVGKTFVTELKTLEASGESKQKILEQAKELSLLPLSKGSKSELFGTLKNSVGSASTKEEFETAFQAIGNILEVEVSIEVERCISFDSSSSDDSSSSSDDDSYSDSSSSSDCELYTEASQLLEEETIKFNLLQTSKETLSSFSTAASSFIVTAQTDSTEEPQGLTLQNSKNGQSLSVVVLPNPTISISNGESGMTNQDTAEGVTTFKVNSEGLLDVKMDEKNSVSFSVSQTTQTEEIVSYSTLLISVDVVLSEEQSFAETEVELEGGARRLRRLEANETYSTFVTNAISIMFSGSEGQSIEGTQINLGEVIDYCQNCSHACLYNDDETSAWVRDEKVASYVKYDMDIQTFFCNVSQSGTFIVARTLERSPDDNGNGGGDNGGGEIVNSGFLSQAFSVVTLICIAIVYSLF